VATDEIRAVRAFVAGEGRRAFQNLKRTNLAAYPKYAEEVRGIADGAGLDVDAVWSVNMLSELELLMGKLPPVATGHCSDLYAVSPGGADAGFSHGHNEDWPGAVSAFWYFVELVPLPGADFEACAGMAYPGNLVGWATTWNSHGMYLTQNSLFPRTTKPGGTLMAFAQREALCGPSGRRGLDGVVASLAGTSWSAGASVNLVDLSARRMANVELYEGFHKVTEVTPRMGNYSHFNMYKALGAGVLDKPEPSSVHRQARVDALPPVRSRADIASRLSDTADGEYPLYRDMTLATFLLDGMSGQLEVWCCGHSAASGAPPMHTWNISAAVVHRTDRVEVYF